jgi:hypothetical protein
MMLGDFMHSRYYRGLSKNMLFRVELYYIPLLISAGKTDCAGTTTLKLQAVSCIELKKVSTKLVEIYKNQTFVRKLYLIEGGMITRIGIIIGA